VKKQRISFLKALIGMFRSKTDEEFEFYMDLFFRMGDKILMSVLGLVSFLFFISGFFFLSSPLDMLTRFGLGGLITVFCLISLIKMNTKLRLVDILAVICIILLGKSDKPSTK